MKQKAKRSLSVVLVFLMVIGIIPSGGLMTVPVMAADDGKFNINMSYFDEDKMEISDGYSNGSIFNCMWRKNNVNFDGGVTLSITNDTEDSGYEYAGAEYRTKQTFGYGYYEVTMKPIKSKGVVSSFFTYTGTPWDEIDIEFTGNNTNQVQFNYFVNGKGGHEHWHWLGFDASEDFHTYGFDWQRDSITWYVDGKPVHTAKGEGDEGLPSTPGQIMMNVWPGTEAVNGWLGAFNGPTESTVAKYKAASYTPPSTPTPQPTPTPTPTPQLPGGNTGNGNSSFPSNVTGKVTFFDLYTDKEINPETSYGFEDWTFFDWRDMYADWEDWGNEEKKINPNPASKPAGTDRSWTAIGRAFSQNVNPKISEYWSKWCEDNNRKAEVYPLYFGAFRPFFRLDESEWNNNVSNDDWAKDGGMPWTDPWYASNNDYKKQFSNRDDGTPAYTYDRESYMAGIHGVDDGNYFSWFLNRGVDIPWDDAASSSSAGAAVQGIVSDTLDKDGNITERNSGFPLPQFNKTFYDENQNIGKMYEPMEFPFVVRERNGANYYEFDSGVGNSPYHDTVRMNADGTALTYSDKEEDVVYGIQGGGDRTPGFFPFNDPQDSLRDDGSEEHKYDGSGNKLNYGFGMKLEVDFTLDPDGKIKKINSDERIPAIFEFSGDDDVWIFVDGKLALDMGGDHGVATGRLDFANNTAEVEQVKGLRQYINDTEFTCTYDASEAIISEQGYKNEEIDGRDGACHAVNVEKKTKTFDIDKTQKNHTLTIFYEERGMYESNFRASFNLNLPTKLTTANQVNVDNVNPGLQQAAKAVAQKDEFTFTIADKDKNSVGKKEYKIQNVGEELSEDGKMIIKDGQSATFDAQFDRDSELSLVQTENARYTTSWTMSGTSEHGSEEQIASSDEEDRNSLRISDNRVKDHENNAFKLENKEKDGKINESVPAIVRVAYKQEPKTNGFTIKKELDGTVTSDEIFEFTVTFSNIFGGESDEKAYDIAYDIYTAEGNLVQENVLASNGIVRIHAGQYAFIKDIPVETKYKVVENEKVGYIVKKLESEKDNADNDIAIDQATGTVTAAVANDDKTADMFIYTNGVKKINDSFLVEVGKRNMLPVIPKEETDGELTGDLKEIRDRWNASGDSKKGLVFIVNGEPRIATDGKPVTSIEIEGVIYEVAYDPQETPVLRVTPSAQAVQGKDEIKVQYQLVELNDDGTVKYNTVPDPDKPDATVNALSKITPVIETTNYFYKADEDIYVLDYGLDVDLASTKMHSGMFENDKLVNQKLKGTTSTYWSTAAGKNDADAGADTVLKSGLIKNGSFDSDYSDYDSYYADDSADIERTVESQAAKYTIKRTGNEDWKVQLKQENIELERNQWYKLTLDAKSNIDRKLKFMIQRNGNKNDGDWTTYIAKTVQLTSDYQTFEVKFKMEEPTDSDSVFSIAMGAIDGEEINQEHQIFIDNISLEKVAVNSDTEAADSTAEADREPVQGVYGRIIPAEGTEAYTITDKVNPKVTYTMSKFLEGKDYYKYGVMLKRSADIKDNQTSNRFRLHVTSDVTIMPASVVYYEDNFNAGTNTTDSSMKILYTGDHTTVGTSLDLVQSNGQQEEYGHDDTYNTTENQQDSGGSSTKLTADGYNTKAVFTFTGTGFDILARTTTETAGIVYTIEKQDQITGKYSLARMGAVDTLYTNGALYQLPVIHEELEHGTYRVTLGIKQTGNVLTTTDEKGNVINTVDTRKSVVYLDGIRIYNPLGESGDQAYLADEQEAVVSEIPGLIAGDGTVTDKGMLDEEGNIINSQVVDGATAAIASYDSVEGLSALGTTWVEVSTKNSSASSESILTYLNAGPNNELYLDEGAALAFVVKATDAVHNTLQIEAKLADVQGGSAPAACSGLNLRVLSNTSGPVEERKIDTICSSTAMYYRIPVEECISLGGDYYLVAVLGNSDLEEGGSHVLSFSNLKHKNYTIGSPYDTSVYDAGKYLKAEEEISSSFVSVNLKTGLKKNAWQSYNDHSVTLTHNVFGEKDPVFTMYYMRADGEKVKLSVTAKKVSDDDKTYQLRFKTPNAKGNFPVEIHYVIDGKESGDYISTTMKVTR